MLLTLKIIGLVLLLILFLVLILILVLLFAPIKIYLKINMVNSIDFKIKITFLKITFFFDSVTSNSTVKFLGLNFKKNNNKVYEDNQNISLKNYDFDEHKQHKQQNDFKNINLKKPKRKKINKNKTYNKKKKKNYNLSLNDIKIILKCIKIKNFELYLKYGFYQPDLTGSFLGIISIILSNVNASILKKVKIIPDFERQFFELKSSITLKLRLANVLYPIICFILNKNIKKFIIDKRSI